MKNFDPFFESLNRAKKSISRSVEHHKTVLMVFYKVPYIPEGQLRHDVAQRIVKEVKNRKDFLAVFSLN